MAAIVIIKNPDKNITQTGKSVLKWNTFLVIAKVRSQLNLGHNPLQDKAIKVWFKYVTLKLQGLTCYVNWAILIGDPADLTTLLLRLSVSSVISLTRKLLPSEACLNVYHAMKHLYTIIIL